MIARMSWVWLVVACLLTDCFADGSASGRYEPRRPGEPSSRERWQGSNPSYSYPMQPRAQSAYGDASRGYAERSQGWGSGSYAEAGPQRFAPTRPGERRARGDRKGGVSTATVKSAYKLYKGYHMVKSATHAAQARTAEELFVEAVEDTTSPPTMAKIITYPVKLVANIVVEVVRTVAVDLWRR